MSSTDISELKEKLRNRRARRVALQFPEGLKRQAAGIAAGLKEEGFEVIVSGDPCYGACDLALDTLSCTDVLVHFGHAPLGDHPNVIFEPYHIGFDVEVLENALPLLQGTSPGLVTTVQHAHLIQDMERYLISRGLKPRITGSTRRTPFPGQILGCSYEAARAAGADEILFIGTGIFHPIGIALATRARVVAFDPLAGTAQVVSAELLLRKRFALIEKARGAKSIGIIVSTKIGQNRMDLARNLASLSPAAILVAMEQVSPDELLNLGFDCYVNTACPRLAYDDQVRFPVPVITPQEFEIICGKRTWDEYEIDEIL
jgi:2-(3-amino-3-carboxypropyl)histidine synthase